MRKIGRREFLRLAAGAVAGMLVLPVLRDGELEHPTQIRMHEANPEEKIKCLDLKTYAEMMGVDIAQAAWVRMDGKDVMTEFSPMEGIWWVAPLKEWKKKALRVDWDSFVGRKA